MSLELDKVAPQVFRMVSQLKADRETGREHLANAIEAVNSQTGNLKQLQERIAASKRKTTWLVAGLTEEIGNRYPAPPLPVEYTVIATDGSHIDVDRHHTTRCCLINIGRVLLRYGSSPDAVMESSPHLYATDEEMVISEPDRGRQQPLEGNLLGIKRGIDEVSHLATMASNLHQDSPSLALLDGSLIFWGLEAYPEFVTEALLVRGFLHQLNELRTISHHNNLALASYISFPRSTEVVNTLRLALCPHEQVDCDLCREWVCDAVAGVQDRKLFTHILSEGERSAVFFSQSSVIEKRYGEHGIHFFYLKLADEIARVEIPQWVATDEKRLSLCHGLILDQCRRGQGYPVALSEAHEQAVVTGTDREHFWQLVETSLVDEHLPSVQSAKSRSKRTRWL